jgi:hypothetical protein
MLSGKYMPNRWIGTLFDKTGKNLRANTDDHPVIARASAKLFDRGTTVIKRR